MSTNLHEFLKKFKANQVLALEASAKTINTTLFEMYKKIVDRTPLGDPSLWKWPAPKDYKPGTLKNSWHMSFNNNTRTTEGEFQNVSQTVGNYGLAFKVGSATVQKAIIYNNQPYAQRVETGWSTQAPQGMMRITIAEYTSILDSQASKYRIK